MHASLQSKVMTAEQAASLIQNGEVLGFSGFTIFGNPKVIPPALAARGLALKAQGVDFKVSMYTGASVGDELDGALARADILNVRMPYQSNKDMRNAINKGSVLYFDQHLSHMGKLVRQGFVPRPTTAIIEASEIEVHGDKVHVYLSGSAGCSATYMYTADRILLELNSFWGDAMRGIHDVYTCEVQPDTEAIPLTSAGQRIGKAYVEIPADKIAGIVETNMPDSKGGFDVPDEQSNSIANYILEFLSHERKMGRLPDSLPYQSGVGNVANAVLASMANDPKQAPLSLYTEVVQDSVFEILEKDKLVVASSTAFSFSPEGVAKFKKNAAAWKKHFVLRQQEISNNPEVVRRLGTITMNTALEADIFGNVNSTHVMGSQMMNGIGGSADFTRNCYLGFFMTPSVAKGGKISSIVPMVSHVDHNEHSTMIFVTEQGLADLRGLPPVPRARLIIEKCAHPDYKPALLEYLEYGLKHAPSKHTPHVLERAFEFHTRFLKTGTMMP